MRLVVTDLAEGDGLGVAGELDLSSASHLTDALNPRIERGGRIVLDVSDLTFMDSTGLQVLIRSALSLGDRGSIVLRRPGNLVRSILELAIRTDKIPNLVIEGEDEAPAPRE
jgi:anti-anti-sigma factor